MRTLVLIIVMIIGVPVEAQIAAHSEASRVRSLMSQGRVNEAKALLIECSDRQNAECQFILAEWIERGDLFQKDLSIAKSLYELSYGNGFEPAGTEILRLTQDVREPSPPVSTSVNQGRVYGMVPNDILKGLVGQRYSNLENYLIRPECREENVVELGVDRICETSLEVRGGTISATLSMKNGIVEFVGLRPDESADRSSSECSQLGRIIWGAFGRSQLSEAVTVSSLAGQNAVRGEPSFRVDVWGSGRARSSGFNPTAVYMDMSDVDDGPCLFFSFRPGMLEYFLSHADPFRR